MKEVDIYDFDKTLVPFDSGTKFVIFCTLHYPWIVLLTPFIGIALILGLCGIISWTGFKKICFSFLPLIPKDNAVKAFWNRYEKVVHPWFFERKREAVVVSASPDFLLNELQRRIGFEGLICTRHNPKTGVIIGKNCRGEEKVRRFYEEYGKEVRVRDVYSDSLVHDRPIFALAEDRCFHIKNGQKEEFNYKDKYKE